MPQKTFWPAMVTGVVLGLVLAVAPANAAFVNAPPAIHVPPPPPPPNIGALPRFDPTYRGNPNNLGGTNVGTGTSTSSTKRGSTTTRTQTQTQTRRTTNNNFN